MLNLLDIVQLKLNKDKKKIDRETIEEVLSAAIEETKNYAKQGHDIYWIGLCKFTWKQKAKTKKEAKEWTEHPYLAEGEKLRFLPLNELDEMEAKGQIFKSERVKNEQIKEVHVSEA
jgi:nucleoid DNA-binding protein